LSSLDWCSEYTTLVESQMKANLRDANTCLIYFILTNFLMFFTLDKYSISYSK